jgi:hypothetical protein
MQPRNRIFSGDAPGGIGLGTLRDRNQHFGTLETGVESNIDQIMRRNDQMDEILQFVIDNPGSEHMLPGFSGY